MHVFTSFLTGSRTARAFLHKEAAVKGHFHKSDFNICPFSVQNSKGLGALLLTGLLGTFTGLIIQECIGSATTRPIGLV